MLKTMRFFRGGSRWYGRVPITIMLATAIGLLVFVAVGVVFGVGVWLAQKNTFDLLSANAHQAIVADVNQFEQHLRPAEHQAQFLADQIARDKIDPANHNQFGRMLIGPWPQGCRSMQLCSSIPIFSPSPLAASAIMSLWRSSTIRMTRTSAKSLRVLYKNLLGGRRRGAIGTRIPT